MVAHPTQPSSTSHTTVTTVTKGMITTPYKNILAIAVSAPPVSNAIAPISFTSKILYHEGNSQNRPHPAAFVTDSFTALVVSPITTNATDNLLTKAPVTPPNVALLATNPTPLPLHPVDPSKEHVTDVVTHPATRVKKLLIKPHISVSFNLSTLKTTHLLPKKYPWMKCVTIRPF